jgi:hypothetical protein
LIAAITEAWATAKARFLAEQDEDVLTPFQHVSDIAERRFYAAAEHGAERLGLSLDDFASHPEFAEASAIFGKLCCLEAAHDWLLAATK